MTMTSEEIQRAKDKIKSLQAKLRADDARVSIEARKADTHIKASLGGEVLRTLFDSGADSFESTLLKQIFERADSAVSKEGKAREIFEGYKKELGL